MTFKLLGHCSDQMDMAEPRGVVFQRGDAWRGISTPCRSMGSFGAPSLEEVMFRAVPDAVGGGGTWWFRSAVC
jgi:hypothetical protein